MSEYDKAIQLLEDMRNGDTEDLKLLTENINRKKEEEKEYLESI
jgi:hypothetical protein